MPLATLLILGLSQGTLSAPTANQTLPLGPKVSSDSITEHVSATDATVPSLSNLSHNVDHSLTEPKERDLEVSELDGTTSAPEADKEALSSVTILPVTGVLNELKEPVADANSDSITETVTLRPVFPASDGEEKEVDDGRMVTTMVSSDDMSSRSPKAVSNSRAIDRVVASSSEPVDMVDESSSTTTTTTTPSRSSTSVLTRSPSESTTVAMPIKATISDELEENLTTIKSSGEMSGEKEINGEVTTTSTVDLVAGTISERTGSRALSAEISNESDANANSNSNVIGSPTTLGAAPLEPVFVAEPETSDTDGKTSTSTEVSGDILNRSHSVDSMPLQPVFVATSDESLKITTTTIKPEALVTTIKNAITDKDKEAKEADESELGAESAAERDRLEEAAKRRPDYLDQVSPAQPEATSSESGPNGAGRVVEDSEEPVTEDMVSRSPEATVKTEGDLQPVSPSSSSSSLSSSSSSDSPEPDATTSSPALTSPVIILEATSSQPSSTDEAPAASGSSSLPSSPTSSASSSFATSLAAASTEAPSSSPSPSTTLEVSSEVSASKETPATEPSLAPTKKEISSQVDLRSGKALDASYGSIDNIRKALSPKKVTTTQSPPSTEKAPRLVPVMDIGHSPHEHGHEDDGSTSPAYVTFCIKLTHLMFLLPILLLIFLIILTLCCTKFSSKRNGWTNDTEAYAPSKAALSSPIRPSSPSKGNGLSPGKRAKSNGIINGAYIPTVDEIKVGDLSDHSDSQVTELDDLTLAKSSTLSVSVRVPEVPPEEPAPDYPGVEAEDLVVRL